MKETALASPPPAPKGRAFRCTLHLLATRCYCHAGMRESRRYAPQSEVRGSVLYPLVIRLTRVRVRVATAASHIQNSHHVMCEYTLRRATTVRGREPVRTTGGQGGSARPSLAGPESTARPGSAHPKSLASSPLHNGCSPETGPESVCTKRQCAAARKWSRQRGHDGWSSSRARSFEDGDLRATYEGGRGLRGLACGARQ